MRTDDEFSGDYVPKIPPGQAISEADALFAQRADVEKLRAAVDLLSDARNPAERNYEVEWKFAKYNYFLGKQTEGEDEASKIFEAGKAAGLIASRMEPNLPDGHFWYGANLGELALLSPITVGIGSVDDIRESMNKVIEIDPAYQGASAWDALAQLEMGTRSFKGGKAEKAVEYLEKGFELNKDNANIRLHLAEAYLAVKRDADARKHIEQLLKMTPHPDYAVEYEAAAEKARKLLQTQF